MQPNPTTDKKFGLLFSFFLPWILYNKNNALLKFSSILLLWIEPMNVLYATLGGKLHAPAALHYYENSQIPGMLSSGEW